MSVNLTTFDPKGQSVDVCKAVQLQLADLDFYPRTDKVPGDWIDGSFGDGSNRAIAAFRAACKGDVVDVAMSQIGTKENPMGSNSGPAVNMYLDSCGLRGSREPWCAAFLTWCTHRWAEHTPYACKFKMPTSAGAFEWERIAESIPEAHIFRPGHDQFTLKRGDIIIYKFSHIGILHDVGADGVLHVVEGNTDYDGSRTGGMVLLHPRYMSSVLYVVRLPWNA